MQFSLFSNISFQVSHPISLVESYCFQSDFYATFDLVNYEKGRKIENVNNIGARIKEKTLSECKNVIEKTDNLRIFEFNCNLAWFLKLDDETRNGCIKELDEKVIKKLLKIEGIGLSKATKVLHTLYSEIIPIIDNTLQKEYRKIKPQWTRKQSDQILIDYYNNLKEGDNWQNLTWIFDQLHNNIKGLTKVRIFDILWWSYLKSKTLREEKYINWSTIK